MGTHTNYRTTVLIKTYKENREYAVQFLNWQRFLKKVTQSLDLRSYIISGHFGATKNNQPYGYTYRKSTNVQVFTTTVDDTFVDDRPVACKD